MWSRIDAVGTSGRWPPAFAGGVGPPAAFLLAYAVWVLVSNVLFGAVFGPDPSLAAQSLWSVPSGLVQFGLAVAVLRREEVRLRDLGLAPRLLPPAVATVVAFLIALNAAVAGLVVLGGDEPVVGPFAVYRSPPLNLPWGLIAVGAVSEYLFVGPVEELGFRGYLQNKLTALPGGDTRLHAAAAVVGSAVAFAVLHVPTRLLLDGLGGEALVGSLALLAVTGVVYGTVYALTRNLYLVALFHGIGNFWPLVVDPGAGAWPNWGLILVPYALCVLAYRRWVAGAPTPADAPAGADGPAE